MQISIPEGVSEDAVVDAVTSSIADALGVHPQDVDVTVDMETGAIEFTVSSDDFGDAAGNQFDLDNDQYQNAIISGIADSLPEAVVDSFEVDDDVTATIEFTVDADEANNDLTQAAWQSEQLLDNFGDVSVDSNSNSF